VTYTVSSGTLNSTIP